MVSFLPGILLDSFWELLGGLGRLLGDVLGFADLSFFRLLSLLMGCVKETVLFFGGFCSVPVALVNCSSSSLISSAANGFICDYKILLYKSF